MTDASEVTAIWVAYNSQDVINASIESVIRQQVSTAIVVDNCSTDETCERVRERFPSVTIIENPKNDGFGRANNVGLKKVRGEYALLVNPDAALQEGAVQALLNAAQHYPDAAILAPALVDESGKPHRSFKRNIFSRDRVRDRYVEPEGDLCAEFLSGAVWLMRMAVFREIGFFDPKIFLYYEDDDLCLRARKAGYGLIFVHDAKATHLMGRSTGVSNPKSEAFKQRHMAWSRLYIEAKYHGEKAALALSRKNQFSCALKAGWYSLMRDTDKVMKQRARIVGIVEFQEGLLNHSRQAK